jgi:hypothetical protein
VKASSGGAAGQRACSGEFESLCSTGGCASTVEPSTRLQ